MAVLNTYFDFAFEGYKTFKILYNSGTVTSDTLSIGVNTCERLLKELIQTTVTPKSANESRVYESVLLSHNIQNIIQFCRHKLDVSLSSELIDSLCKVSGYYVQSRYPTDVPFIFNQSDLELVNNAVELCLQEVSSKVPDHFGITRNIAKSHNIDYDNLQACYDLSQELLG